MELQDRLLGLLGKLRLLPLRTWGIHNETADAWFVPFLDYDEKCPEVYMRDLKKLNRMFGLCCFFVLMNSEEDFPDPINKQKLVGSYGVIGLCKNSFHMTHEFMRHTRTDRKYIRIPEIYSRGNWVRRIGEKRKLHTNEVVKVAPILKEIITFKPCFREHSLAHFLFMQKYFNIKNNGFFRKLKFDKNEDLEFIQYGTR